MKKYLTVFINALESLTEYRLSLMLDVAGNLTTSLVLYLFWRFLAGAGMDIRPYDVVSIGFYFLLVAIISIMIGFDATTISRDIKDGEIAQFVLKPISYMWLKFANSLPDKLLKASTGIIVFIILAFLGFSLNMNVPKTLLFFLAIAFSVLGNYLIYYSVGLLAFWTQQTHGFSALVSIGSSLVSGSTIPIELLPGPIMAISQYLPFRYFLFFPVQILLGELSVEKIFVGIILQIGWVAGLYVVSNFLWRAGQRKLEAVGI